MPSARDIILVVHLLHRTVRIVTIMAVNHPIPRLPSTYADHFADRRYPRDKLRDSNANTSDIAL